MVLKDGKDGEVKSISKKYGEIMMDVVDKKKSKA
jgi:hypothetical protein